MRSSLDQTISVPTASPTIEAIAFRSESSGSDALHARIASVVPTASDKAIRALAAQFVADAKEPRNGPLSAGLTVVLGAARDLSPGQLAGYSVGQWAIDKALRPFFVAVHPAVSAWRSLLIHVRFTIVAVHLAERRTVSDALKTGLVRSFLGEGTWPKLYPDMELLAKGQRVTLPATLPQGQLAYLRHLQRVFDTAAAQRKADWFAFKTWVAPRVLHAEPATAQRCASGSVPTGISAERRDVPRSSALDHKLASVRYGTITQYAGVGHGGDVLTAFELKALTSAASALLSGPRAALGAAVLLIVIVGSTYQALRYVRLGEAHGHICLTDDCQAVSWDWYHALKTRDLRPQGTRLTVRTHRFVRIPLPEHLAALLRRLREAAPAALSVHDLLACHDVASRDINHFLRQVLPTPGRGTQSNAARSYGPVLLGLLDDALLATVTSMNFLFCPLATLHYATVTEQRITQACIRAYAELGMGRPACMNDLRICGTPRQIDERVPRRIFCNALERAWRVLNGLPRRCDVERVRKVHNVVASALFETVAFWSFHRYPTQLVVACSDVSTQPGTIAIADKPLTAYDEYRLVPLPAVVAQWLARYLTWLGQLASRLERGAFGHDRGEALRTLAGVVTALASPGASQGSIFFHIDRQWCQRPCTPRRLECIARRASLRVGWSRHTMDAALRARGLPTTLINAAMGRAGIGQRAYDISSLAAVQKSFGTVRSALDDVAKQWTLPLPEPAAATDQGLDDRVAAVGT